MTTNPTITVELKINGTWTDVSGWVDVGEGGAAVVITRGRENEQADIQPGTCTFSLTNDDGRFSLELPTGAYYPYFKRWIEVRVTIKGSRRFTGYVSNVETTLDDETGLHSHSAITCTDAKGVQAQSPVATSWASELISDLSPLYWWPLSDPAGSTVAAANAGSIPMTVTNYSQAATPVTVGLHEFGTEGPSSLEADGQIKFTPNTNSSGEVSADYLVSAALSLIPSSFTILCLATIDDVADGGVLLTLANSSGRMACQITEGNLVFSDSRPGGSASSASWPGFFANSIGIPALVALAVTPTTISVVGAPSAATDPGSIPSASRPSSLSMAGSLAYVGGGRVPDGAYFFLYSAAATISHLAIVSGVMTQAQYEALRARLLSDGLEVESSWLAHGLEMAGIVTAPALTRDRQMHRPTMKGSNPAEIGDMLAKACGGAWLTTRDGTPKMIDQTYCPTWVTVPFEHVNPDVTRAPDPSLTYTDVSVDGTPAATSGGWPRSTYDIPGLLPDADRAEYVAWLASTADVWAQGRLATLTIDLLPLNSATTDTYLALDVRSRILPTGVPAQFPADTVHTVEGSSEILTKDSWQITLNTAPDPRFVLGESLLGSDYRLGWE